MQAVFHVLAVLEMPLLHVLAVSKMSFFHVLADVCVMTQSCPTPHLDDDFRHVAPLCVCSLQTGMTASKQPEPSTDGERWPS